MENKKVLFFNNISFFLLLASVFFSLFFFVPYSSVFFETAKGFLISFSIILSLFFWFIARMGEGKFDLPKDRLILFAGLIPGTYLLASIFSFSTKTSILGNAFEINTFISMFVMFVMFFLATIHFQDEKKIWYFLKALLFGSVIISFFTIINIFFGIENFLPGFLKGVSSGNLVGNWGNFSLLFGLIVLLTIHSLEFLKTKKTLLILQYFVLISGIFFLTVINFSLAWTLVGIFSAIMFIYSITLQYSGVNIVHGAEEKKKFPLLSLVVLFLSFLFLISGNFFNSLISNFINIPNIDVRPSIISTGQVILDALKHNIILGTGPNTFDYIWPLWQPNNIAESIYWNANFTSGFSFFTTLPANVGILGFAAFSIFLFVFFSRGVQSIKIAIKSTLSNYFIFSILITAAYLWIVFIFYNPNIVLLSLAFISSGILIGILVFKKAIPVKSFSFFENSRKSFVAILLLMFLMIGSLSLAYFFVKRFTAIVYFSKGSENWSTIDKLVLSEKMLLNASALEKKDIFYRSLSQIYVSDIAILINDKEVSEEILKISLQQLVTFAESSAKNAVLLNSKSYLNYLNLGDVYSSFVSLSIPKSYENAVSAYNKAKDLAPRNPSILLARAELELINKNIEGAKKFISQALEIKPNYIDAIFFLAQIENEEGNISGAIKQVEYAGKISPGNPEIFFRLGLLRYNNGDYREAASAFEQTIILNPGYLNARYLLGSSYQKIGMKEEALVQYKILEKIIPENEGLKNAINSINSTSQTNENSNIPIDGKEDQ